MKAIARRGSLVYCNARLQLTNVEIHSVIDGYSEPRGIWIATAVDFTSPVYPGCEGEWRFDNVTIHDIVNPDRGGIQQPLTGGGQGLYLYWPETVGGTGMQFVMLNSEIYNIWGDECNGMIANSQVNDISFTNNTLWFENVYFHDCERRAVKNYIGNSTWINCTFRAVDRTNPNIDTISVPAGLFNMGARSAAIGSNNNLVCGCTFKAAPGTPFDAWENKVSFQSSEPNGVGVEIRNCTFESGDDLNTGWDDSWGAGIKIAGNVNQFKICNSTIGVASTTARGLKLHKATASGTPFSLEGGAKIEIDSNNSYIDGNTESKFLEEFTQTTEYVISDLSSDCAVCPSIDPGTGNPPIITLTGTSIINLTVGDTYTEFGAVWNDVEDGTGPATIGGDIIPNPTDTIASYTKTYNHTDTDLNPGIEVTRTVNVSNNPTHVVLRKQRIQTGINKTSILYLGGNKLIMD